MKIEKIKIGEIDFTPESFASDDFRKAIQRHCKDLLKHWDGVEQGIIQSWFELLQSINSPRVLDFHEQIVLACMEVKAAVEIIWVWERSVPSKEELRSFTTAQLADILDARDNPEDFVEIARSIHEENQAQREREENKLYIELFDELDFSKITFADLQTIYSVLEDTEFDEDLVAYIRWKNIWVYYTFPEENSAMVMLRVSGNIFYVKNTPRLISLTQIENHWEQPTNGEAIEYFYWISYKSNNWILRIQGNTITWSFCIWDSMEVNGVKFSLYKNHDSTVDVYDETNNVLHTLSAESYYNLNGKWFRFFLDTQEKHYYDFFGNRFSWLKTLKVDPLIHEADEEQEDDIDSQDTQKH